MIPGYIVTLITFPGIIVHEFAHKLFCRLTGTKVIKVCYFRFSDPVGYVVHEPAQTVWRHIIIGIGPFIGNTVFGFFIGLLASRQFFHAGRLEVFGILLTWLGISIAMHSFPSTGDAKSIWSAVWRKESPVAAKLIGTPLVAVIFLGAIGSVFWLDLIYGVAVALGLPKLILG